MASSQGSLKEFPLDGMKARNAYVIEPKRTKRKMPRNTRKNKSVRFSEYSSLILTKPYTGEDTRSAWWTKNEIAQFKKNTFHTSQVLQQTRTAKMMKHIAKSAATGTPQANVTLNSKEAIRGLEHLIAPQVWQLLVAKRRRTVARVLEVQHEQKIAGISDPLEIATVSEMNSAFSKEWCSRITDMQHA